MKKTVTVIDLAITRSQARAVGRSKLLSSMNGGEKKKRIKKRGKGEKRRGKEIERKAEREGRRERKGKKSGKGIDGVAIRRQINCDPSSINNIVEQIHVIQRAKKRIEEDMEDDRRCYDRVLAKETLRSHNC